jgi:hypothetical protein
MAGFHQDTVTKTSPALQHHENVKVKGNGMGGTRRLDRAAPEHCRVAFIAFMVVSQGPAGLSFLPGWGFPVGIARTLQ